MSPSPSTLAATAVSHSRHFLLSNYHFSQSQVARARTRTRLSASRFLQSRQHRQIEALVQQQLSSLGSPQLSLFFRRLVSGKKSQREKLATGCISAEPIESLRLPPEIFDTGGQLGVVSSLGGFGGVSDPPELRAFCRSFRWRVSAFVSTVQSGKN
jgi:hypothetical protein